MVEDPLGHSASLMPPWELDYSAPCQSDAAAAAGAGSRLPRANSSNAEERLLASNSLAEFLTDVDGTGNVLLPFLDDGSPPPSDPSAWPTGSRPAAAIPDGAKTEDESEPGPEPEPAASDAAANPQPLRRGLRPRTKPRQYNLSDEEDSDGDWAPSQQSGRRKRGAQKRPRGGDAGCGHGTVLPRRQAPLPPDVDDKQRRRILRNRASAERSRLRRLGQIATLQQENEQLRAQLAAQSSGAREAESETQRENSRLRSELQLARSRVAALERALVDSARESNPLEFAGGTAQGVPRSYGGPGGMPA